MSAPLERLRMIPAALWLAAACFLAQPAFAQQDIQRDDTPTSKGGWQGLANVLDALTPSIDTSIAPSAAQITARIAALLEQGQNDAALQAIQERKAQLAGQVSPGQDAQLLFLEARALAALQRNAEAAAIYTDMTIRFPELPEPWNNLANEYVRQGLPDRAREALQMALIANPDYAVALSNLGTVQLMLARQAWEAAAKQGISSAAGKAKAAQQLLDQ